MKRMKSRSLLVAVLLATVLFLTGFAGGLSKLTARAEVSDELLYRLTFDDENIGKNSAGTQYADAVTQEGNALTVVDGPKGGKALNFPGDTKMKNYLSLPTDLFDGLTCVTFAGWFFVPTGIEAYLGEFGIWSESNRASFRVDPFASYHNGNYMFCVGDPNSFPVEDNSRNNGLRPVYDAWYHMAYVIDGENHTFTVYQNGTQVHTQNLAETDFTPAEFNAGDAHFYLGQSSYEDSHNDYKGKMSDIRVYGGVLTEAEINSEYNLTVTDFMTAEYTFDTDGTDSVRGYNLAGFNGDPVYEGGVMKLSNGAAAQAYVKNTLNSNFFVGHSSLTVSMDINIHTAVGTHWRRVMDMFANDNNRITYMAYCPRADVYFDAVYANNGDNNMLGDNSFTPKNNEWFNLTIVLSGTTITVWEDGVLKVTGTSGDKPDFKSFLYSLSNEGNFTIGNCSYEPHNYLDADYDNIRIYAAAAKTAEEVRAARAGYESYALRYDANNGSGEYTETLERVNSTITVAANTFTYEGYRFTGWNTLANGEGTSYAPDETFTLTADTTLYAQWAVNSYRITFHANGGRGEMAEQIMQYETATAISDCGFARTGYTFAGWATQEGGAVVYTDGQTITPESDLDLWAVWTAKTYSVTFNANGGTGSMTAQTLTFDTAANLTTNTFTRHGYTFAGWALTETGVVVYTDGQEITAIGEGDDVTLYAVWTIGTFSVTFHANGGTGTMASQSGTAFAYITLNANTFTYEGKHFVGWATSASGEAVYEDEDSISLDDNVELWAVWEDDTSTDPDGPGTDGPGTDGPGTDGPGTDGPGTDGPGTDDPNAGNTTETGKKGCKSVIGAGAGAVIVVLMATVAVAVLFVKKRKN